MKKIITISMMKDGSLKMDLGKEEKPMFMIIGILSQTIGHFAKYGYEKEKKDGR